MLSVLITARNEQYLQKTIENVLENAEGEIEIIAVMDGYWSDPPLKDDPRVRLIHNTKARGQRHSINDAARIAKGKYIMKLDAHCAVAKGFDVVLARDCEYDMTMIPRMYNLDVLTWKPKLKKWTDHMYISSPTADKPFRAAYMRQKDKDVKMIDEIMVCMGPGFFMHKDRFWELGGCDEKHGGWGQQGIEVACKAWLSGGRLMVNKNTWFAHWFRGGGVPKGHKKGFPWSITNKEVQKARKYSQDLWLGNNWDKQTRDFQWLVDKFNPPTWERDMTIIYYTDDCVEEPLKSAVIKQLEESELSVVAVSNEGAERSHLQLFKNILRGAKGSTTKYVAMAEHDCFYPKEHFQFTPPRDDTFYYDTNHLFVSYERAVYMTPYKKRKALSGLICNRELLIKAVEERIKFLEDGGKLVRGIQGACEFGIVDEHKHDTFESKVPYLDVRHRKNFSGRRRGSEEHHNNKHWGSFDKLIGRVPDGKWYQEATINGVKMPQRRLRDTNEKRWKKFVEPLVERKEGVFTDLGCNAGFYCRKMKDFTTLGVEREPEFQRQASYWESCDPTGIRYFEQDINDYELTCSQIVLMANIHYWLTPEQLGKLKTQLDMRCLDLIMIGRHKTLNRHASPCDLNFLKGFFGDWELVKSIEGDKHVSVLFRNTSIVEKDTEELFMSHELSKSQMFYPSYSKLIQDELAGRKYTMIEHDYFKYLTWRSFLHKERMFNKHVDMIHTINNKGIINPLIIKNNKVTDGDHRLIVAKNLGIKKLICKST